MKRKIKILLTIPNFETAGSKKVLFDLANGLDKEEFDVSIACDHNKGAFFQEIEKLGLPIFIIKTTTAYRPYFSLARRMQPVVGFLKKHKFDIVHSWHWSSDWTEPLAARRAGAKFVYTKKAMSWGNKHWKIRSYLAHFIFTINEEMRSYFPNKKNQELVPLGINTHYYSPDHFPSKTKGRSFEIVTVANLVPVKGIEVLIKALALINDDTVRLKIVGGGDPDYIASLKTLSKGQGVMDQVAFLGKQMDVRPFIARSDVYVIPTLNEGRKEGMPMALVEAMSMGVPVLGSDISGINFVLKDFPYLLFSPAAESELAKRLQEIMALEVAERKALGNRLRNYCNDHFAMEQFIENTERIYKNLVH